MTSFCLFCLTYLRPAIALPVHLEGYAEIRALFFSKGSTQWQTVERIRPSATLMLPHNISLLATFDISTWQGREKNSEFVHTLGPIIESAVPPPISGDSLSFEEINEQCEWDWIPSSQHDVQYFFDRLQIDIPLPFADIRIGRQALHWGTALFINPTDVFPQTLAQTPWQERTGIGAVNAKIPLVQNNEEWGQLQLIATIESVASSLLLFQHLWEISVVGIANKETQLLGMNLRGENIVGWWGEMAYYKQENSYWKGSLGLDYTLPFSQRIWLFSQITHDSSGQIPALYAWNQRSYGVFLEDCPSLSLDFVNQERPLRDTLGKWYGLFGQKTTIENEWEFSSMVFMNLSDSTGIHSQFISYKGDRVEGTIGFQQRFGTQGEFMPPPLQTTFQGTDMQSFIPTWRLLSWLRLYY